MWFTVNALVKQCKLVKLFVEHVLFLDDSAKGSRNIQQPTGSTQSLMAERLQMVATSCSTWTHFLWEVVKSSFHLHDFIVAIIIFSSRS